jgi:hypothetical protein
MLLLLLPCLGESAPLRTEYQLTGLARGFLHDGVHTMLLQCESVRVDCGARSWEGKLGAWIGEPSKQQQQQQQDAANGATSMRLEREMKLTPLWRVGPRPHVTPANTRTTATALEPLVTEGQARHPLPSSPSQPQVATTAVIGEELGDISSSEEEWGEFALGSGTARAPATEVVVAQEEVVAEEAGLVGANADKKLDEDEAFYTDF